MTPRDRGRARRGIAVIAHTVLGVTLTACQRPARLAPQPIAMQPTPVAGESAGQYAAVNGTTLWYESAGRGSTVVLLHGANLDRRMWDAQFAALAREHRVIRYDARGFGRSGPADAPFAAHDDLLALLRSLGVTRASLVGLSLGGRIAIDFALAHPEMVDRLVLSGPGLSGWTWAPERDDEPWKQTARAALARHDTAGVAVAWLQSDYMRPAMEQAALAPRLREITAENARNWASLLRHGDLERPAAAPAATRLAELRAPTLLVVGDRDVPDIRRIVDSLGHAVRGAHTVVFVGAGHMANMEQPAHFTTVVSAFLRP